MHAHIIDDNDLVRNILPKYIQQNGHCTTVCREASTAFSVYQDNRTITHIWVDIYLDRYDGRIKDGLEFISLIRSFERDSMIDSCYIVGFSADGQLEEKVLKIGADRFLKTPIDSRMVREIMRHGV